MSNLTNMSNLNSVEEEKYSSNVSQWNSLRVNVVQPSLKEYHKLFKSKNNKEINLQDVSLQLLYGALDQALEVVECFESTKEPFNAHVSSIDDF